MRQLVHKRFIELNHKEPNEMRIYVACLASYNNGVLYGRWIDASSDTDEMSEEIATMLRGSKYPNVMVEHPETGENVPSAEEYAFHDMEGLPRIIGEYSSLSTIADFVALCEEYGHIDESDMVKIVDDFGSVEDAKTGLEDRFAGIYESFRDYADESADEMMRCHDIKDDHPVSRYFDYEAYARDLKMDMNIIDVESGVAVFYA
jgi:antirestriction protein